MPRYDTYRLRSRRSQVDETLFGEPLSRQLLNRSKSMEVRLRGKEVMSCPGHLGGWRG